MPPQLTQQSWEGRQRGVLRADLSRKGGDSVPYRTHRSVHDARMEHKRDVQSCLLTALREQHLGLRAAASQGAQKVGKHT